MPKIKTKKYLSNSYDLGKKKKIIMHFQYNIWTRQNVEIIFCLKKFQFL